MELELKTSNSADALIERAERKVLQPGVQGVRQGAYGGGNLNQRLCKPSDKGVHVSRSL